MHAQSTSELLAEIEHLRHELDVRNCALDAATTHFMILDANRPGWPVVYCNRAVCRDHGYEPEELLNRDASKLLIDLETSGGQLEEINDALRFGQMIRSELQAVRKNGSKFWVGMTIGPVFDEHGVITHFVSIGTDITVRREEARAKRALQDQLVNEMRERERMAIELRLAQKLEAVGMLASGIAHEINTPIQYVGDSIHFLKSAVEEFQALLTTYPKAIERIVHGEPAEAILKNLADEESRVDMAFLRAEVPKAFDRTLDGVERVASIVKAMKEFAHPDSNEQRPADINRALESTLVVTRNEYKYVATAETQLEPLPPVTCNIGELNQVFLNLIVNAAHAIADTGKDVSTGRITIATASAGNSVSIRIGDNGCGIRPENIEKIFDPFFTTKAVGKGTGQGLALARTIVERHGGAIAVESTQGVGTTFVITLPVEGAPATSSPPG